METNEVVERFLCFLPIERDIDEYLATNVVKFLQERNIDIGNARGQSYDNASNMSGKYNGMRAKISELNPLAIFIPCTAHSLNLVGQCAVDCFLEAVSFFGLVQ